MEEILKQMLNRPLPSPRADDYLFHEGWRAALLELQEEFNEQKKKDIKDMADGCV